MRSFLRRIPFQLNSLRFQTSVPREKIEKCVNMIILLGRVGSNPVIRQATSTNTEFATFPICTNHHSPNSESGVRTFWHRVIVFTPFLVNTVCPKIVRGDRVFLRGYLSYREQDINGINVNQASVVADEIVNLTGRFWKEDYKPNEEQFPEMEELSESTEEDTSFHR